MSYRFMRLIVFFDLPTESPEDRRAYRLFRRMLIKNGFTMWQESVYCRMVLNAGVEQSVVDIIRKNRPPKGIVSVMAVTERQYAKTEYITGQFHSEIIDNDDRLVIL